MAEIKYVSQANLVKILGKIKATYVQQVEGKGLSTNDLTNELLAKLNAGQANIIESVQVNGVAQAINGKAVNITVPTKVGDLENDQKFLTVVTEANLDASLKEKVLASAEGNHGHTNKGELDLIAEGDKAKWDQATTDVNAVKADYLKAADKTELQTAINTEKGRVDTLVGSDANKSVRTIANEELAAQLIPGNADAARDTLTEIAAWIQSHPGDAAAMNAAITALQNQLSGISAGEGTVKKYVDDAITALKIGDYAKAADLTALAARVTTAEGKIQTLEGASHTHANAEELAKFATGDKAKWDAVAADYVKASEMVAYTDSEIDSIWTTAMA